MRCKTKLHYFTGFKHCGGEKVWLIEGQGFNAIAFTSYKSAVNYRNKYNLGKHRIWCCRASVVMRMRNNTFD